MRLMPEAEVGKQQHSFAVKVGKMNLAVSCQRVCRRHGKIKLLLEKTLADYALLAYLKGRDKYLTAAVCKLVYEIVMVLHLA